MKRPHIAWASVVGLVGLCAWAPLGCGHAAPPPESAAQGTSASVPDAAATASSPADAAPLPATAAVEGGATPSTSAVPPSKAAVAPVFESQGPMYPAASLRDVFEKNESKLLTCFLPAHKADPTLRGHVNVKFTINGSGKAGAVQDQASNLPDPKVVSCVVKVIKSLRFEKPEGSVTVVYPFIFHSSEPFLILPDSAPPPSP